MSAGGGLIIVPFVRSTGFASGGAAFERRIDPGLGNGARETPRQDRALLGAQLRCSMNHGSSHPAQTAAITASVTEFCSVWHLVGNAIEENVPPFRRLGTAYGELFAESHFPRPGQFILAMW